MTDWQRRVVANGLVGIEATPMQVARAFAGLAAGSLPELRLVSRIGGVEQTSLGPEPIDLDPGALARIRRALEGVANEPGGTAYAALREQRVGYRLAVKTGSADLTSRPVSDGRRLKHTWVAGWLPAERPRAVFCVFVHETLATSSHGAVYLVRQLLEQPEVVGWLSGMGVERR